MKQVDENKFKLKEEDRTACEIYSRVMGYFRPKSNYNIGKKQEFEDRVYYKEPNLK